MRLLPLVRERTLDDTVNLFLQLKVNVENNSKTESIEFSSFEVQFLYCCHSIETKIWKVYSQLVAHCTQFIIWQKIKTLPYMTSQTLLLLLLDSDLRVNVCVIIHSWHHCHHLEHWDWEREKKHWRLGVNWRRHVAGPHLPRSHEAGVGCLVLWGSQHLGLARSGQPVTATWQWEERGPNNSAAASL